MESTPFTIAISENNQSLITELLLQNNIPVTQDYNQLCTTGNYDVLKQFTNSFGMRADTEGMTHACQKGYLNIVQLLLQYDIQPSQTAFHEAIRHHRFLILQYLFSSGFVPDQDMLILACATNQMYLMFYINKLGVPFSQEAVDAIIPGNFLKNLQFAYSYGGRASSNGFNNACELGHQAMIDFLLTQGFVMDAQAGRHLLSGGHVDLFKYYQPPLEYDMWFLAVENEDESFLEWLYDRGLVPDEAVLDYAMLYGLESTVYFFINIGLLPTSNTIRMGQVRGHDRLTDELIRIYDFTIMSAPVELANATDEKGEIIENPNVDPDEKLL